MKSPEEFFAELSRSSRGAAFLNARRQLVTTLHPEVHQAANRGLQVFPVPEVAQWTGRPEQLIGEATVEVTRLEVLAAENPCCCWRAASSGFCILRLKGSEGRAWFAAKNYDQGDCRTLIAVRGEFVWAVFQWPAGLVLRASANVLAAGVRILTDGESFPIPPTLGSTWADPSAEIEAVPYWMREIAFEPPDCPPAKAVVVPSPFARPLPCRAYLRIETPQSSVRKGYPCCHNAGWSKGFRVSRRR